MKMLFDGERGIDESGQKLEDVDTMKLASSDHCQQALRTETTAIAQVE